MNEQGNNIIKQAEETDNQEKDTAMDSKMMYMMAVMMLGCVGAAFLPAIIPAGWLFSGFSFVLLAVIMLVCCIPMIKMMWTGIRRKITLESNAVGEQQ
jgi:FtsH-binding integral membrane protein